MMKHSVGVMAVPTPTKIASEPETDRDVFQVSACVCLSDKRWLLYYSSDMVGVVDFEKVSNASCH